MYRSIKVCPQSRDIYIKMTENTEIKLKTERHKYGGGPHGLGDPDDLSLRKVEREILIPQKMRDKAKVEKCAEYVKKFTECCANNNILMVYKCREENDALKACLTNSYENEEFKKLCKEEYLKERSEFRRTGITKNKQKRVGVSM